MLDFWQSYFCGRAHGWMIPDKWHITAERWSGDFEFDYLRHKTPSKRVDQWMEIIKRCYKVSLFHWPVGLTNMYNRPAIFKIGLPFSLMMLQKYLFFIFLLKFIESITYTVTITGNFLILPMDTNNYTSRNLWHKVKAKMDLIDDCLSHLSILSTESCW